MVVTEQINSKLQKLPASFQREVLHFVEFLTQKARQSESPNEEKQWSEFSLEQATHGLEDEELTPQQKAQAFESWASGHRVETPVLLDDSREVIYEDA